MWIVVSALLLLGAMLARPSFGGLLSLGETGKHLR